MQIKTKKPVIFLQPLARTACLLCIILLQLICNSCNRKPSEQGSTMLTSGYQVFVMNVTVDQKNVVPLRAIVQKDLLSLIAHKGDIKSVKTFNAPLGNDENQYIVFIELVNADKKGIRTDKNGKVTAVDFSQFISDDPAGSASIKTLMSLKDLVKSYDVKAFQVSEELTIDRMPMGTIKKLK